MFTKNNNKLANKISILNRYWDGTDITNSVLLKELPNLPSYNKILVTSKRYDLLAETVYGSSNYSWILRYYTGLDEDDLQLNTYLNYPEFEAVKELILSLDEYNN